MPYKKAEDQARAMREYRKRKKTRREEILKESYDPFMDAYVLPREKLKEII